MVKENKYPFREAPELRSEEPQSLFEVKEEQEEPMEAPVIFDGKNYAPKITIWGCGGFGVDRLKELVNLLDYPNLKFKIIDTSEANTHKQGVDSRIEVIYAGKHGRGAIRGEGIEVLHQKVDQIVLSDESESDIDILFFSLTAGTGSVVGPLAVKALLKNDKPIIIITVADNKSTVATENSLKTIQSIESISHNSYVNMILFDNSIAGEEPVNHAINKKMMQLLSGINLNQVRVLDQSDILVAMKPHRHKILSDVKGLFIMRVNDGCKFSYDDSDIVACHSSILVGKPDENMRNNLSKIHTSIHYDGKWVDEKLPISMFFGLPLPEAFLTKYNGILKKAQAASAAHNTQSGIKVSGSEIHNSGLVI